MKTFGLQYDCGRFAEFGPQGGPHVRIEFENKDDAQALADIIERMEIGHDKPFVIGCQPEEIPAE